MALAQYAKDELQSRGLELAFPDKPTFKEFVVRVGHGKRAAARAKGINAGYPIGRDYAGLEDSLLVAVTERRTTGEIDRLVEALA